MPRLELGWKTGFEPATLGITIRCSNRLSYIHQTAKPCVSRPSLPGAPGRNRTCNHRLRRPVLYPVELRAPARMIPAAPVRIHAEGRSGMARPGRGRGIRTHDIQLPKLALYQAELYPGGEARRPWRHTDGSHSTAAFPAAQNRGILHRTKRVPKHPVCFALVARPERFELPTPKFVAWCSIQLSYGRAEAKLCRTFAFPSTSCHHTDTACRDFPEEKNRRLSAAISQSGGVRGIRTLDGAFDPILP